MLKKNLIRALLLLSVFLTASCELTWELWENSFEDEIEQFLSSDDGYYVIFLSKKYHYVFTDSSRVLKTLLSLERDKVVTLDLEKTYFKIDRPNNLRGNLAVKTFDLDLSGDQFRILYQLGFHKSEEEGALFLTIPVTGKIYLNSKEFAGYQTSLESYGIKVKRHTNFLRVFEDIALTPLTLTADSLILLKEIVLLPFGE